MERNNKCAEGFSRYAARHVFQRWKKILPNVPKALQPQMQARMTRSASRAGAELRETATDPGFQDKCTQLTESKQPGERKTARKAHRCLDTKDCQAYVECFMAEAGHLVGYRAAPSTELGEGKGTCEGFCVKFGQCFWTVLQASGKLTASQMSMLKNMPKHQLDRLTDMALKSCRRDCARAGAESRKAKHYATCALETNCASFARCAKETLR